MIFAKPSSGWKVRLSAEAETSRGQLTSKIPAFNVYWNGIASRLKWVAFSEGHKVPRTSRPGHFFTAEYPKMESLRIPAIGIVYQIHADTLTVLAIERF